MITLKQCMAHLSDCEASAAKGELTLRRATAVLAVCHTWLALRDAGSQIQNYRWRGKCVSSALEAR
jgi:hypothetical protein